MYTCAPAHSFTCNESMHNRTFTLVMSNVSWNDGWSHIVQTVLCYSEWKECVCIIHELYIVLCHHNDCDCMATWSQTTDINNKQNQTCELHRCIQIKQPWTNLDTNHLAVHKLEHKSLHALYYSTFSNNYRCRYGSINYCGYAHPQQGKWSQPKELHRRPQLQCSDQLQSVRNVLHPQSHLWQQHPGPAGGVLGRILWGVQPLLLYPPPAIPLSYAPPLLYPLSPSSLYPLISMPLPFSIPISLCPPCTLWPISVVHDIYYLLPIAETVQQ